MLLYPIVSKCPIKDTETRKRIYPSIDPSIDPYIEQVV